MQCEFSCFLSDDDRLIVRVRVLFQTRSGGRREIKLATIEEEDVLIQNLLLADLPQRDLVQLLTQVLLAISGRAPATESVKIEAEPYQLALLGLCLPEGDLRCPLPT